MYLYIYVFLHRLLGYDSPCFIESIRIYAIDETVVKIPEYKTEVWIRGYIWIRGYGVEIWVRGKCLWGKYSYLIQGIHIYAVDETVVKIPE
jgi:hypothetical protein